MNLTVNPNDKTPIYRQLYEQIASQVLSGALVPGTPLPPIRTVSRELGVSMITVRGAWDMLERDGYLVTRTGSGCFVAPISAQTRDRKRSEKLTALIDETIAAARAHRVSEAELFEMVQTRWNETDR